MEVEVGWPPPSLPAWPRALGAAAPGARESTVCVCCGSVSWRCSRADRIRTPAERAVCALTRSAPHDTPPDGLEYPHTSHYRRSAHTVGSPSATGATCIWVPHTCKHTKHTHDVIMRRRQRRAPCGRLCGPPARDDAAREPPASKRWSLSSARLETVPVVSPARPWTHPSGRLTTSSRE